MRDSVSKIRCRETEDNNQDRAKEGWADCTLQAIDSSLYIGMTVTRKAENMDPVKVQIPWSSEGNSADQSRGELSQY